jgi:hypothetical protein
VTDLLLTNGAHLGVTLVGAVLLIVLLHLQERATSRFVSHRLGWRAVLFTGWLGVPVHELSHLLAAKLFGHRIVSWRLFDPDPVSGTLGYVRHAYARRSAWQLLGNVFIGLAPLLAGALVLCALLGWLVGLDALSRLWEQARQLAQPVGALALGQGIKSLVLAALGASWRRKSLLLPLQFYLGVCVASHMAPSKADLSGSLGGGLVMLLLLLALTAAASYAGIGLAGVCVVLPALALLVIGTGLFQAAYAGGVALGERLTNRIGFGDTV